MRITFCLLLTLCACSTAPSLPPVDGAALARSWRSEVIVLPPKFAPSLPPGEAELRFAPGMFEAGAEDYWSYVFVLRLAEQVRSEAELETLLEAYYDGLIDSVARSKGLDVGSDAAQVQVQSSGPNQYRAQVDLVDPFVTEEALRVHILLDASSEILRAAISPKEPDHPLWRQLLAVRGVL